jgi:hypothetical protein
LFCGDVGLADDCRPARYDDRAAEGFFFGFGWSGFGSAGFDSSGCVSASVGAAVAATLASIPLVISLQILRV